jgi:type IV secretion system protein TrbD
MVEGFEVPIHQSLTDRQMLAGIPRDLAILIWTFVAAFTMPVQTWYALPIGLFLHVLSYRAVKRDPDFYDVLRRALRYRVFYRV